MQLLLESVAPVIHVDGALEDEHLADQSILLRSRLARNFLPAKVGEDIIGMTVELTTAVPPDGVGQARFRGSVWKVYNAGSRALEVGARCRVDEVKGVTLTVGKSSRVTEEIESWTQS